MLFPKRWGISLTPYEQYRREEIQGKRVILVESHSELQRILSNRLRKMGLEVLSFEKGQEALGQLESDSTDLVITGLDVQDIDGQALAEKVKEKRPDTPVILLSSLAATRAMKETNLFSSVLPKPISHDPESGI